MRMNGNPNGNPNRKNNLSKYLAYVCVCLSIVFFVLATKDFEPAEALTYDQVINLVNNGDVVKVETILESNQVDVTLQNGEVKCATVPSLDEFSNFISAKVESGEEIEFIVKDDKFTEIVFNLFKNIIIWGGVFFIFSRMIKVTNVKVDKVVKPAKSVTKFEDVAGINEEKEQLAEIVTFLKNPKKYTSIGAKIPRGVLLNGEPGTGKTLLAKAIAGEAGVPFFQMSGSNFDEMYVGVGASRVRKLFETAKAAAPSIIFIDEIDSVAKRRDRSDASHMDQTLNQILTEMDGFSSNDDVIVIAATNRLDVLDPAILRPGRFDRQIYVPKPDVIAREEILKVHAKDKKFSEGVSFLEVAKMTVGFSGADLENLLNEAAIHAVNHGRNQIYKVDIDEAIARVQVGLEKKNVKITEEDKKLTAVHEAGHAVISALVRPHVKNLGISIIPRGNAGGYNSFDETDTRYLRKTDMQNHIKVLYGGRVAEEVILGDISTGASNDLERISDMAYLMVTKYAMDNSYMVKTNLTSREFGSKHLEAADVICDDMYTSVHILVENYKEVILKLANLLMEKEYLSQEEVADFMKKNIIHEVD